MIGADRQDEKNKRGVVAYNPLDTQKQASQFHAQFTPQGDAGAGFDYGQDPLEWLTGSPEGQKLLGTIGGINPTPRYSASSGSSFSDMLAQRKYEDEQRQQRRQIEAYQQLLSGGGYRGGQERMLGMLGAEGTRAEGDVGDAYQRALANIAAGFTTAQDLTSQGYGALEQYLRANPNNPYANVQVSAGGAPDAMQNILSAYGVSAEPVLAQVAAEQQAAQQGAQGFQNLLSTLGASAQQSDASRLAEMQMAQTLAGQTLGTQRAGMQSQAEQARANALAQIRSEMAQARMQQEAAAEQRRQAIEDALIALGGRLPQQAASTSGGGFPAATYE